jgi:hypothetical protein
MQDDLLGYSRTIDVRPSKVTREPSLHARRSLGSEMRLHFKWREFLPNKHIDYRLGPERNPRQGFSSADILRWTDRWRRVTRRPVEHLPQPSPEGTVYWRRPVKTGMDEFFAKVVD